MLEKVVSIHLDSVSSTNTYAKDNHPQFDWNAITRITADTQTAGRGSQGRHWISPREGNLYLTYFFISAKNKEFLNTIGQITSLKIVKLLRSLHLPSWIKWPNDVLIGQKKIVGILCETIDLQDNLGVILGIGMNVNMSAATLQTIDQPATSLSIELGAKQSVSSLVAQLDTFFQNEYPVYQKKGFHPFYLEYCSFLSQRYKPLLVRQNGQLFSGTYHSLHPDGRLNVLLEDGKVMTFSSGEIFVKEPSRSVLRI